MQRLVNPLTHLMGDPQSAEAFFTAYDRCATRTNTLNEIFQFGIQWWSGCDLNRIRHNGHKSLGSRLGSRSGYVNLLILEIEP
jgi:hypothetical protein